MMRDGGLDYNEAHENASEIEFALRRQDSDMPVATERRFRKSDLPSLAKAEVYDWLREKYLEK